jgi:hypothetical protein
MMWSATCHRSSMFGIFSASLRGTNRPRGFGRSRTGESVSVIPFWCRSIPKATRSLGSDRSPNGPSLTVISLSRGVFAVAPLNEVDAVRVIVFVDQAVEDAVRSAAAVAAACRNLWPRLKTNHLPTLAR